jgi:hypothetical protein
MQRRRAHHAAGDFKTLSKLTQSRRARAALDVSKLAWLDVTATVQHVLRELPLALEQLVQLFIEGDNGLSPGQSGDKRDDIFVYALRMGERPVCHPASVSSDLGTVTGGVVLSKLSKLLNQEDALSVPCLIRCF